MRDNHAPQFLEIPFFNVVLFTIKIDASYQRLNIPNSVLHCLQDYSKLAHTVS